MGKQWAPARCARSRTGSSVSEGSVLRCGTRKLLRSTARARSSSTEDDATRVVTGASSLSP